MNCEKCGKFVFLKTAGKVGYERSDLDGVLRIYAMWCKKCAGKLKELKA